MIGGVECKPQQADGFCRHLFSEGIVSYVITGIFGFGLYFLYDINSVIWQNRILHLTFLFGSLILCASTVYDLVHAESLRAFRPVPCLLFFAAVFFLILLIYTLFFALPFEATYVSPEGRRAVYDKGVYALCRHPGVLWFFLFYLFLGLAVRPSRLLPAGMFYSFLDLLYVIFQDFWTFPRTFTGYDAYKDSTPFLLPSAASIRRAVRTHRRRG